MRMGPNLKPKKISATMGLQSSCILFILLKEAAPVDDGYWGGSSLG